MELLDKVVWCFSNKNYQDLDKFSKKVFQYNKDILDKNNKWNPEEIVLLSDKIDIYFEAWLKGKEDILPNEALCEDEDFFEDEDNSDDGYFQAEMVMHLEANNQKYFTAVELLFKIHNQLSNKELGDHVFFEGVSEVEEPTKIPAYYLNCGS